MRRLVLVAMMVGLWQGAHAADLPVLRGFLDDAPRNVRTNWEGFYVGGQAGVGSSDMNFTNATAPLVQKLLFATAIENEGGVSQWPVLGRVNNHGAGFGGFVGYNAQWDDVIIGIEANYLHGNFGGSDTGIMSRSFSTSNGYTNAVNYEASAAVRIKDMGTVRIRAGYAWDVFMPYIFGAAAFGFGDISQTARVFGTQVNASAPPPFGVIPFDLSISNQANDHLLYGYAGGAGLDVLLVGGLFARGEWEYVKFAGQANTSINTVRAALGYKF